jgi:transcription elongation factor Elf1
MTKENDPKSVVVGAQPMEASTQELLEGSQECEPTPTNVMIQLAPTFKCDRCRQNQWFTTQWNDTLSQFWIRCPVCGQWVAALSEAPFEEMEVPTSEE